ncbi:hypothetical protein FACS1894187_16030 [Synergistales bacterium]|nr:hypothetical protein FACS1894187_16030 [Synergistales bacterium]
MKLRDYQNECIQAICSNANNGIVRQLVSLPTGSGKTVIFASLIKNTPKAKVLVLAHRDELLSQAKEKIYKIFPEANAGILRGDNDDGLKSDICIASVQSAIKNRRLPVLKAMDFDICICDEAHHSAAKTYATIFKDLGFSGLSKKPKLLVGFTATATRADGKRLTDIDGIFQKIVYEKTILEMIKSGYLSDIRAISVGTDVNISKVKTQSGDFKVKELQLAVDIPYRNELIVRAYETHANGKKGVVFGVNVDHSHHIAATFNDHGINCEAVWGNMGEENRHAVLDRFKSGETKVLSNCNLLIEGFDDPEIKVLMMARPTKSHGLYVQCVGRGLRLSPGKTECLLLDFVDVSRRHSLENIATLTEVKPKNNESLIEAIDRKTEEKEIRLIEAKAAEEAEKIKAAAERAVEEATLRSHSFEVNLFGTLRERIPENYRRNTNLASEPQKNLIKNLRSGIVLPDDLTMGEARFMIQNLPLTKHQRETIVRNNLHPEPDTLTWPEAKALIDIMKETEAAKMTQITQSAYTKEEDSGWAEKVAEAARAKALREEQSAKKAQATEEELTPYNHVLETALFGMPKKDIPEHYRRNAAPASESQKNLIRGIRKVALLPDNLTKGEASFLIQTSPLTDFQHRTIVQEALHPNPKTLTWPEAKALIDAYHYTSATEKTTSLAAM